MNQFDLLSDSKKMSIFEELDSKISEMEGAEP